MNPFTEQDDYLDGVIEARILRGSPDNYQASVHYKALAYRRDRNLASMTYSIKKARAFFDPNLGPSGGWRCPVGTRYGGQITDRFGRNCGWGVARRLANTITDTGERLERTLDKRRIRRVTRRNERVTRQIGRAAERAESRGRQAGRAVTPRGRVVSPPNTRQRRGAGRPERMERAAREVLEGTFLENRRRRRAARAAEQATQRSGRPRAQRQRRGAGLPERMDRTAREVLEGTFLENRRRRRSERRRRETAQVERTTPSGGNRRPTTPTAPAGSTQRRTRRTGPRIDIGQPGSDRRRNTNEALKDEKRKVNDFWATRLRGRPVNAKNIRDYVAEREQRDNVTPAYLNTLRARERDHRILNGQNPERRVDELSPSARRRINDRLNATPVAAEQEAPTSPAPRPRTPRPEATPAPSEPNRPAPAPEPEPQRPVGPRTSDRRLVRVEDLSDDPVERRKLRKEAEEEVRYKERLLARQRLRLVADNNGQGLTRHVDQLRAEEERLDRVANDTSRDVVTRYRAREVSRLYGEERRKSIEARDRVLARQRAAQEATQAPEAPAGPRTPRQPETGRRVETFGLSKEQRAKLDRFVEDDRTARQNQTNEIADLNNRNDSSVDDLLQRRLADADELLADYERDLADDNADPSDRYIAQQSIDSLRTHRNGLRTLQQYRAVGKEPRSPSPTPTPATPTPTPTPVTPEAETLIPDAQRQAALKQEFAERSKKILEKRKNIVGNFMKQIYGSGKAPWTDRTKNPDVKELGRLLDAATSGDADARRKVTDWAKQIYELPEFEGKDGVKFKTSISGVTVGRDTVQVVGSIQAQTSDGRWLAIGQISRTLHIRERNARTGELQPNFEPYVKQGLLKITSSAYKNSGFASVYNPHAFTWLKAAGFKKAKVGTMWDGKFVWGKLGFRTNSASAKNLVNKLEAEVKKIRQGGRSSVVNKRDADRIAFLIDEARRRNFDIKAPQHAEFLMAMSNRDSARVKSWFTRNAPFNGGEFFFDEVADDPRK